MGKTSIESVPVFESIFLLFSIIALPPSSVIQSHSSLYFLLPPYLIFCLSCYFFSFLPWGKVSWTLDSRIIWGSGPLCDWPRMQPSPCFVPQRPWSLLPAVLPLSVEKFGDNKNIGCHSHPLPLRKAFLLWRAGASLREQNFGGISPSLLLLILPPDLKYDLDLRHLEDKVVFRALI